jgi:GNAT superfamily N-acetyltransferase
MTLDDRPAIRDLMGNAFAAQEAPMARERWEWLFGESRQDLPAHYLVADAAGRLAGQFATLSVRLQHRGAPTLGLVVVDMATDPAFQKQGVFTALAREIYDRSAAQAPIVFGFPNASAAPIHYGRFNWVELRPFPFLLRPLGNVRRALQAARPGLVRLGALIDTLSSPWLALERAFRAVGEAGSASVAPFAHFSDWADELWRGLSPTLGTCVVRDAAYLNWRFCRGPYAYRRFGLHRDGRPVGFAVTTFSPTRLGKLCHLMELMAPHDDRAGARLLLAHAFADAVREGASAMCAIATRRHPHRLAMAQTGFLPAPARMKAQLSFGVRLNGLGALPNELLHIDDWYLSGADRDTL